MNTRKEYKPIIVLEELKCNLRITDAHFDANMSMYLSAAISQAGKRIGRDLNVVDLYSFGYSATTPLSIDPAMTISQVEVNGQRINNKDWCYSGGYLNIYKGFDEQDEVVVRLRYNDDIKVAIILHATALFLNPTDSVESLPKASVNLLKQYRKYEL